MWNRLSRQVKGDEIGRTCSTKGEKRDEYRLLMVKPDGKGSRGKPKCRWLDVTKMNLGEIRWMMWPGFIWLRIWTSGGH